MNKFKKISAYVLLALLPIFIIMAKVEYLHSHTGLIPPPYQPLEHMDVDWTKAEKINIEFDDDIYAPDELNLKKGVPYVFVMRNIGNRGHDFVDLKFFHNITTNRIHSEFGRINTHHVHSIYLSPGKTVSVELTINEAGVYDFFCSLPGHREEGMEGNITVNE